MTDFKLILNIDKAGLRGLQGDGQRVTLAKSVGGEATVVWLSIEPVESATVEWSEEYWLYASSTPVEDGAMIEMMRVTSEPVRDAGVYPFTNVGVFGAFRSGGIPPGSYAIANDAWSDLTFGLAQSAEVNRDRADRNPISARSVRPTKELRMTPSNEVHVWLQRGFAGRSMVTSVPGSSAVAKFGGSISAITMEYDPKRGVFLPDPKLVEDGTIELREPPVN